MFSSGHPFRADSLWTRLFQSQPHTQEVHQKDLIGGKESRHLRNSGAPFYQARREMTLGSGTHEVNSHISLIRFRQKKCQLLPFLSSPAPLTQPSHSPAAWVPLSLHFCSMLPMHQPCSLQWLKYASDSFVAVSSRPWRKALLISSLEGKLHINSETYS